MATKIQIRRGTSSEWATANPTLAEGEMAVETDTKQLKIGNGATAYNSLAYVATGNMTVAGSTLDNLNDGTTYKRIAAAVATALNAGTYDAATVSAFGIGVLAPTTMEISCDNYTSGGFFKDPGNITNSPWGNAGVIAVFPYDANNTYQIAFDIYITRRIKIRQKSTTWSAWYEIWNAYSDGNGGQPPQPKSKAVTGAFAIGERVSVFPANDAAYALPNPDGGSTWEYLIYLNNYTTYGVDGHACGIAAGGTEIGAAVAGYKWRGVAKRIA